MATTMRRCRILTVDDHPMVRIGLEQLISDQPDLEICGACESAEEALRLVETTRPDVVLLDLSLKGANGLTLIRDLRLRHRAARILVYSMHDEMLFAERAIQAGAMGYVNKQTDTDELLDAIRRVAQGGVAVSPRVAEGLLVRVAAGDLETGRDPVSSLSNREIEVFQLLGRGLTVRQIAEQLNRSVKTVETHRERIARKLNLNSSAELIRRAVEWVVEADRARHA